MTGHRTTPTDMIGPTARRWRLRDVGRARRHREATPTDQEDDDASSRRDESHESSDCVDLRQTSRGAEATAAPTPPLLRVPGAPETGSTTDAEAACPFDPPTPDTRAEYMYALIEAERAEAARQAPAPQPGGVVRLFKRPDAN